MPSDYCEAIEYLYGRINYERTSDARPYPFRLRRMTELVQRLDLDGVIGRDLPLVHIAGTKGKGSTATMVAAMLTASGLRTGLYTSPHLNRLEERFVVDAALATPGEVCQGVDSLRTVADAMASGTRGAPTFFELTTALALLHFKRRGCQAVVLEVGLGGQLDSTNVCHPAVTAITSIGLDHQHILGNTLAEIAAQKAGITKPAVPVVTGQLHDDAAEVIRTIASQREAPLYALGEAFNFGVCDLGAAHESSPSCESSAGQGASPGWGSSFDFHAHHPNFRDRKRWTLPLDGTHQGRNAAVACAIVDLLSAQGVATCPDDQIRGMANVSCPGRLERFALPGGVDILLDTAHNEDSIRAFCEVAVKRAAGRPITVIFGTSRDKDHRTMLAQLAAISSTLILTRYHGNPRYREPSDLLAALPPGITATIEEHAETTLRREIDAGTPNRLIAIVGSFFLAAELRPMLVDLRLNRPTS